MSVTPSGDPAPPSDRMEVDEFPISDANRQSPKSAQAIPSGPTSSTTVRPDADDEIVVERSGNPAIQYATHSMTAGALPTVNGTSTSSWITSSAPVRNPNPWQPPVNLQHAPSASAPAPYGSMATPPPAPFMRQLPQHAPPAFPSAEKRYSSTEKGKGRAPETTPQTNGSHDVNGSAHDESGRGKREKQKRRLSNASEEGHSKSTKSKNTQPVAGSTAASHAEMSAPISKEDEAYFERVAINKARPSLGGKMKGPCPVWSNTRRALLSSVEYMANTVKTSGASVAIGSGGMARGIILEGQAPSDLTYWGKGGTGGTLMLPIGRPRARRTSDEDSQSPTPEAQDADEPEDEDFVQPIPSEIPAAPANQNGAGIKRTLEAPEIEALLMTHRARIPIAVTVAHDYSAVNWRVPRPFVVLGWFWITDAWVEPVLSVCDKPGSHYSFGVDIGRVVWKFRFEFCSVGRSERSGAAWWQFTEDDDPRALPLHPVEESRKEWALSATNGQISVSYTPSALATRENRDPDSEDGRADQEGKTWRCRECDGVSARPYARLAYCINETCGKWTEAAQLMRLNLTAFSDPMTIVRRERLNAASLKLNLRPPEPADLDLWAAPQPKDAGREYWAGWVCHTCGCANERYKWRGWSCEACKRQLTPNQTLYRDSKLRNANRPVSTSVRPDDGLATWPFEVSHAWTLFTDDIKVIRHGVEAGFGSGTIIYHSLNHNGSPFAERRVQLHHLFNDLQRSQHFVTGQENPLRRHTANPTAKHAERYMSQFYTMLLGPEPVPAIEGLPTGRPIPWREVDQRLIDLADFINERAGQMFPGEPERFNSLLVAVSPPGLAATQAPRIYLPANSITSFTFLGSDGVFKFRRPVSARANGIRQGQITAQHGDVVGVETGAEGLEVIAHQEGFGFLCIGRQIYRIDKELIDTPAYSSVANHKEKPPPPRRLPNPPPPRPTKLPHVPLTFWYIGPFPLDPERPLKVQASARVKPSDIAMPILEEDQADPKRYTGIELDDAEGPKILEPPPLPGSGKKRKPAEQSENGTEKEKVKHKEKDKEKDSGQDKEKGKGGAKAKAGDGSPAKKKSRKSAGSKA